MPFGGEVSRLRLMEVDGIPECRFGNERSHDYLGALE